MRAHRIRAAPSVRGKNFLQPEIFPTFPAHCAPNVVNNCSDMNLTHTHFRPPPEREVPAIVRIIPREDVQWNRPLFKAPQLVVIVPTENQPFARESARAPGSVR
ncbi:MAG: hypothetical protein JWM88_1570 [Verrucomicrobia bacterium]|nr:hypothetical protein [Verrucomicrobiota bacterium]